ncbi:hypothetical protein HN51_007758 [Arachis hypogaea]
MVESRCCECYLLAAPAVVVRSGSHSSLPFSLSQQISRFFLSDSSSLLLLARCPSIAVKNLSCSTLLFSLAKEKWMSKMILAKSKIIVVLEGKKLWKKRQHRI